MGALYQREEHGFGTAGGAGAIAASSAGFGRAGSFHRPRRSLADIDLVVDLGSRIGTGEWFRGLATLAAMIGTTIWLAPGIKPITIPAPAAMAPAQYDEMRSLAIAPTAYGADTGRRLAPTDRARPLSSTPERPQIDIQSTLGFGDGLARVLEREGAAHDDAVKAASLVASAVPLSDIAAGTKLAITLGRRPSRRVDRPIDALSFRARFDLALNLTRVNGELTLQRLPIAVDATPMRLTGAIGGSLYEAERNAGAPPSVVADYIKAIAKRVAIDDIMASDRFDMVFEHKRAATGEVQTGRLLYAGIVHEGETLRLARWTLGGREQWFDASGAGETRDGFTMPVSGARMSSGFGMRFHPILGFSRMHQGVDLAAPYGTPIVAAADGVVRFAGWHGGHGNFVQIAHDGGMGTGYGHMSRIIVRPGETVQQGELIGYVGSTGLSTGPHCHFEVYRGGQAIDPASASFERTERIGGGALAKFKAMMARWTGLPVGGAQTVPAKG
ncbi:M23 family metallopeptidase [Sphingomonas oryzagri]|uniref:M23 family metallopeptidase n=1 Tax=Sphingomonas oryzagri TaxID=3042314 RepID=A0ABT6N5D8_9SPHN|nr:M23 family metallopeptidase [Sphingomonas oryzagri]MDH7640315.1 M23 family metallopeptidase [Sphingomonas oryzagri]